MGVSVEPPALPAAFPIRAEVVALLGCASAALTARHGHRS